MISSEKREQRSFSGWCSDLDNVLKNNPGWNELKKHC